MCRRTGKDDLVEFEGGKNPMILVCLYVKFLKPNSRVYRMGETDKTNKH